MGVNKQKLADVFGHIQKANKLMTVITAHKHIPLV